jgi:tartrate dehydratase alpha subunit/fumarate hydratase class I-like protein
VSSLDRTTLEQSLYHLVVETATNLPADVRAAIRVAREREDA